MNATIAQEEPGQIGDAEYHTLEQTLLESDRGRRFLAEFLRRQKTPETTEILAAVQRLERVVTRQREVPNLDKIRLDIADMHEAIERTKAEIANIKAEGEASNRFMDASHELDAIVTQTEGATQSILEAAEKIQEKAWVLRENGADDATCDDIDAKATEIFMACSFQDLTGQRTNKVVQVLSYLESRINLMINIWGIEEHEADETAGPEDSRPDAHLLNGPQLEGKGVCQNSVDELMSANTEVFQAALKETGMDADPEEPSVNMDAAAIDDMFASSGEAEEDRIDLDMMGGDPEAALDEAAIDKLFDTVETDDIEQEAAFDIAEDGEEENEPVDLEDELLVAEAVADAEWSEAEKAAEIDSAEDPLEQLTEAERQALFN